MSPATPRPLGERRHCPRDRSRGFHVAAGARGPQAPRDAHTAPRGAGALACVAAAPPQLSGGQGSASEPHHQSVRVCRGPRRVSRRAGGRSDGRSRVLTKPTSLWPRRSGAGRAPAADGRWVRSGDRVGAARGQARTACFCQKPKEQQDAVKRRPRPRPGLPSSGPRRHPLRQQGEAPPRPQLPPGRGALCWPALPPRSAPVRRRPRAAAPGPRRPIFVGGGGLPHSSPGPARFP